jgi:hypothetical protein
MEARPPTENRHGGAPRGERVPPDARRASVSADGRARQRDNRNIAPFRRSARPSSGRMEKRKSKTRAQKRAAGTKKTALFDMVNRNYAATRSVPAERAPRRVFPTTLSCPGQARASASILRTVSVRAREPGPRATRRAASASILRFASLCAGSTQVGFTRLARIKLPISGKPEIGVSFRFAPLARDTRACASARLA